MNKIDNMVDEIIEFYNVYNMKVSGKISDYNSFDIINTIEKNFSIDNLKLDDGTRIWNLLRIFIYSYFQSQKKPENEKKIRANFQLSHLINILKESMLPLKIYNMEDMICGFSSTESRKFRNGMFFDIYLDPLYDIFGKKFLILEWPNITGFRRKYRGKVYSKHFIPMHFPIYSITFWKLIYNQLNKQKNIFVEDKKIIDEIINVICEITSVEKYQFTKDMYNFIKQFYILKKFFLKILKKLTPEAVFMKCGYGRFPMALSQSCRELDIPSIELQHGLITMFHPAYIKKTKSINRDCVPEYLFTHGDIFSNMVREGNMFDVEKIYTVGYPYLDLIQKEKKNKTHPIKSTIPKFDFYILFTSQWILSKEINRFIEKTSDFIMQLGLNIGIIFKPHPYDYNNYTSLHKIKNIVVTDKYEDIFSLLKEADIHSTVYSTSALEAMTLGKPNIFIDVLKISRFVKSPLIANTPNNFVELIQNILEDYETAVETARLISNEFFKSNALQNIKHIYGALKND